MNELDELEEPIEATPLAKAIERLGSQSALARAIGGNVKQQHVWHWMNESKGRVPAQYCGAIEAATEGHVTRHSLRPDIFGPAPATQDAA